MRISGGTELKARVEIRQLKELEVFDSLRLSVVVVAAEEVEVAAEIDAEIGAEVGAEIAVVGAGVLAEVLAEAVAEVVAEAFAGQEEDQVGD